MSKYKYYFRKPRSEIVKDILKGLLLTGAACVAATSPYFVRSVSKSLVKSNRYRKKIISNTFYRLKKEGCIETFYKNNQLYIKLTEKGRKKAGWMQIDELKIKKMKKWDKKWRLSIFDISELKKLQREAFRGKLKELGFLPIQKSVWINPYDCKDEIGLLKDFFGLSEDELRLVIAEDIGEDDVFRQFFKI